MMLCVHQLWATTHLLRLSQSQIRSGDLVLSLKIWLMFIKRLFANDRSGVRSMPSACMMDYG
jgi:hypothetical protein